MLERFSNAKRLNKDLTIISVHLKENARVTIDGFSVEFNNIADIEVALWVNNNTPILDKITLLDVLLQREFHFIVANTKADIVKNFNKERLLLLFSYPFRTKYN